MKHSIRAQLAAMFTGLMAVILSANLLANYFFLERYYIHRLEDTLTRAYRLVDAHMSEDGLDSDYFEDRASEINQLFFSNNMDLIVLDEDFQKILSTRMNSDVMAGRLYGYTTGLEPDENVTVLRQNDSYRIQRKRDSMMDLDYLEMWGSLTNRGYFMIRIPMSSIHESVGISARFTLLFSVAALVLCFFLIWIFSTRFAKPVRELTELSNRMADLDFDARYTSGGSNEIGQLGEHFNRMSDTLQETISQLKSANNELQRDIERKEKQEQMRSEFISSVSHELKTPIALIRGYAEGLQECVNDDPESREFYCDVIVDEADKMNEMVQKLLTLNQLEFGADQVEMSRFDIAALIRGKMQSLQILAQQKEAVMTYDGPDELHVWGDEYLAEEVLTNYLSNALNHVDGERRIIVSAGASPDREKAARFTVFNTGEQIPEEDIDRLWEKFYKVDKARTREYGGSGVGLSIVKAIMDSFHQPYGVNNVPDRDGVEFWFELEKA